MNYSKGKWKVIGSFITAPIKDDESKEEYEIEICRLTQYRDDIENKANANLIAAAPDMYEALKDITEFLVAYCPATAGLTVDEVNTWPILNRIQKTIAKAEGRIE